MYTWTEMHLSQGFTKKLGRYPSHSPFYVRVAKPSTVQKAKAMRLAKTRKSNRILSFKNFNCVLQRGALYQVERVDTTARQALYYLKDLEGRPVEHSYYQEVPLKRLAHF